MKCLVTGGLGFIGSNLSLELLKQGHEVYIMDIDHGSANFADLHDNGAKTYSWKWAGTTYHADDIRDIDQIDHLLEDCNIDVIFHLAALPRVQYSIAYPTESNETNITGTLNLLESARKHNIKRFVYSASSSAYGDQDTLPLVETMKENPMSPYALQKLAGEKYCKLYHDIYGMETVSLRYFNVFGPRQSVGSVYAAFIPKFIDSYINNTRPTIFGDGKQSRDFTHIDNVVQANILAAATDNKKAFGDVFNVGASNQVSTSHVDKQIRTHLGTSLEPIYGEAVIEPKHTKADLTKIRSELGYEVLVDFDTGLKKTIEWFKNKG